jgi:hypothetical protein
MRLGPGLLYEGRTLQGARPKLADFCSATMAEFYSAVDTLGLTEARALLKDPASLSGRINAAEETVEGLSAAYADRYRLKAKALAVYMVKGDVTSEHLLRNARAIAHLFGEGNRPDPTTVGDDLIQAMVLPTRV